MKVLIVDSDRVHLDLVLRATEAGHEVRWWIPRTATGAASVIGDGYAKKWHEWEPSAKWADLIVLGDNSKYAQDFAPYFNQGYPIFGCSPGAAQLELDRGLGQWLCEECGMEVLPYSIHNSYDEAIAHVEKTMGRFVSKPWGGSQDKALSYVSHSPEDLIFKLEHWKKKGRLDGQIMLQEAVEGIEMAVGGWFCREGWFPYYCENFEEKKFMNEGLGQNTGEQGTTLRYTKESKLFDRLLEPVTGYLHKLNYVGYVDMNAIIEPNGHAWPLEFTMRFGYPLTWIQQPLHKGDPVQWMADAVNGRHSLKVSQDTSVGVVVTHGHFPNQKPDDPQWCEFPLYGVTPSIEDNLHYVEMQLGEAPVAVGRRIRQVTMPLTAGCYILCATGTGRSVTKARDEAYKAAWQLKPPSNRMFRTDIGKRLEEQLPKLQAKGYALGMEY